MIHNNSTFSLNRDAIRRKIFSPIIDSNPMGIIQARLAKGEITIEEYEILEQNLKKISNSYIHGNFLGMYVNSCISF